MATTWRVEIEGNEYRVATHSKGWVTVAYYSKSRVRCEHVADFLNGEFGQRLSDLLMANPRETMRGAVLYTALAADRENDIHQFNDSDSALACGMIALRAMGDDMADFPQRARALLASNRKTA